MTTLLGADRSVALPALGSVVYLNTGSAGPLLEPAHRAMIDALARELVDGRSDAASWQRFLDSRTSIRERVAALIGATAPEIALTHHTTEGLDISLWGVDWQAGDRIAVSSLEHDAGLAAVHVLAQRFALEIDVFECEDGDAELAYASFAAALSRGPRAALISHVAYGTGAVLPIARMAAAAREAGVLTIVDGAQAVGALTVDVVALGVDAYSFNGYKFLFGPEGSGALYVRGESLETIRPAFGGAFGVAGVPDAGIAASTLPVAGAARYETGSWFRPQLVGLDATLEWTERLVASGGGPAHVARIAAEFAARLADEAGAIIRTPNGPERSGLVTFTLPGRDPRDVAGALEARGIIIRSIPGTDRLRASCASFTTGDDLSTLIAALHDTATAS